MEIDFYNSALNCDNYVCNFLPKIEVEQKGEVVRLTIAWLFLNVEFRWY